MPPTSSGSMSFHPAPFKWRSRWIIRFVALACALFAGAFLLFNAPLLLIQLRYNFTSHITESTTQALNLGTTATPANPQITISKIGVTAPIVFGSSTNESTILTELQSGVIHYPGTALPGQSGNVAIFGHSSGDWWEPGNYKFIFTLLSKLKPGDTISLDYQGQKYTYQVTGSQVVPPTDFDVLNPTTGPTLSLITCTPIGTSLNRLVVTADQVSTNPVTAPAATTQPPASASAGQPSTLPASPGVTVNFWSPFVEIWNTLVP